MNWDDEGLRDLQQQAAFEDMKPDASLEAVMYVEVGLLLAMIGAWGLGAPWYVFMLLFMGMISGVVGLCFDRMGG